MGRGDQKTGSRADILFTNNIFGSCIVGKNKFYMEKKCMILATCMKNTVFTDPSESVFRNEEKLVALLVNSLFKRVSSIIIRRVSVLTNCGSQVIEIERKWGMNTGSLRIQYRSTVQHSDWKGCDVTRLVATEDIRNNYSLRKSFSFFKRHAALNSFIKLHCLN